MISNSNIVALAVGCLFALLFLLYVFNMCFPGYLPFLDPIAKSSMHDLENGGNGGVKAKTKVIKKEKAAVVAKDARGLRQDTSPKLKQKSELSVDQNATKGSFSTSDADRKIGISNSAMSIKLAKHLGEEDGGGSPGSTRNSTTGGSRGSINGGDDGKLSKLSKKLRNSPSVDPNVARASLKDLLHGDDYQGDGESISGGLKRSMSGSPKEQAGGNPKKDQIKRAFSKSISSFDNIPDRDSASPAASRSSSRSNSIKSSHDTGFSPSGLALALEYVSTEQAASSLSQLKPLQAAETLRAMNPTKAFAILQAIENAETRMIIRSNWDDLLKETSTQ